VELEKVLIHLAEGTRQALRANATEVCLLDSEGACLQVAAASGLPPALQQQQPIPVECSQMDGEALSGEPVIIANTRDDPRATSVPEDYCSVICVPLLNTGEAVGTLRLYAAEPHFFGADDISLLMPLADLGAAAIVATRTAVELEALDADTNRFIHVATHELRSPVTAALSLVRGVLKGYAGELTERQIDVLERVGLRLDFLAKLVDDLLDLAAGRAAEVVEEGEPVLLNAAVSRVLLLLEPQAEEKGVEITLEPCPTRLVIWGTEEGLHRVFVNLVSNAIKYTPSGGTVAITVQQVDEQAQVSVVDTGIGIPQEALPYLFDAFYRAPNAKQIDEVGSGLGLTIARDIVEHFGGGIEVESTVGEGTTFTVIFPIHRLLETVS
jgi:signal transduction histidine kinase